MAAATGAAGLTDTDILIDASRGWADAVAFLTAQRAAAGVHQHHLGDGVSRWLSQRC